MPVETDILPPRYSGPRLVARGGMGEVYRATDDVLGRAVAVKVLAARYSADDEIRSRFTREALAAARLSGHPHAVTIFDVGDWHERPFIVMEYLAGGSLADRLHAQGAQRPDRALAWLEQAATALDAAHRNGIVHRDVKPANILLDRDERVYVADFGVASAVGLNSLTLTGTILGTAGYLAPEQARGEPATAASDRYALGVTAWELLAGERPFRGDSPTAEALAHLHAPVPSLCARNPRIPCELDRVLERALAKEPVARFPTCAEFVAELRAALDRAAGVTARMAPLSPTPAVSPRRPKPVPGRRTTTRRAQKRLPILLALLAAAGAGIAVAAIVGRGGSADATVTLVRKVTAPGTTVRETVTQSTTVSPPPTPPPPAPPPPPSGGAGGHTLNDRGYARMQAGDYAGALPLLQQAVAKLAGVGPADPYEGYANYNLGYTLLELRRCDEALGYLHRADSLEPGNAQVHHAIERAQKCGSGGKE